MAWARKKYFVTFDNLLGFTITLSMVCLLSIFAIQPATSKVIRLDSVDLVGKHYDYLYEWYNPDLKPKAVIVAAHGLTLHGRVYDGLANYLAEEGILFLAPDLPGYGRRCHKKVSATYIKAQQDMLAIVEATKATYKDIPLFCLGESLGANLALSTAQARPDLVDGVILSSPALETRLNLTPQAMIDRMGMVVSLVKTDSTIDMSPYMKSYASEDPTIVQAMLNDPLIRRHLNYHDLWDSYQGMKPVFKQASLISKSTSVLIMQGSQDRILKAQAIIKLVSSLKSDDQTIRWFNGRGHMILEECQPKPDVLLTLDDWLKFHIAKPVLEARATVKTPITSSLPPLTQTVLDQAADGQ